jgi:CheY-like chemotaxis protein
MKKLNICLLVEDDPDDQEFFLDALHKVSQNTGCYAVSNGEEALTTLLQDHFYPDYIFTDINMPRMNGFEFLTILKGIEKFRDIPIIIYSSDSSEEQLQKAKRLGATAFYSKTNAGALPSILTKYFAERPSTFHQ